MRLPDDPRAVLAAWYAGELVPLLEQDITADVEERLAHAVQAVGDAARTAFAQVAAPAAGDVPVYVDVVALGNELLVHFEALVPPAD